MHRETLPLLSMWTGSNILKEEMIVLLQVIYLVLLNLPREERFKWGNIIVPGIIPEKSKEPKSMNPFLSPLSMSSRPFGKE